ncbi:hypothetical protein FIBSPDRAFT_927010, partial [Athelia psychrophila]
MDLDEHLEYALFVGAAEWTRDPKDQKADEDLYVEVNVDGASQVHRTLSAKTAQCWDQDLRIAGRLESIIYIEIKSGAHNSSDSLSIARADASLKNLLESCADGDLAALALTIAPLVSATTSATVTDVAEGLKHSASDIMGLITVKLCWAPRELPNLLQPRGNSSQSNNDIHPPVGYPNLDEACL